MYEERISTIYKLFTVDFNRFANPSYYGFISVKINFFLKSISFFNFLGCLIISFYKENFSVFLWLIFKNRKKHDGYDIKHQ